ncbi:MAG: hypothetical protein ACLSTV_03015 [Coriobacteriales bacterium]
MSGSAKRVLMGGRGRRRLRVKIQSMTTTKTADVEATVRQIDALKRRAAKSCARRYPTRRRAAA